MKLTSVLVFLAGLTACLAARILVVVPIPGKSHSIFFDRIAEELASRGHEVTYVSAFPMSKKVGNLTHVVYRNFFDQILRDMGTDQYSMGKLSTFRVMMWFPEFTERTTNTFLSEPPVQELLNSDKKFDLFVGEAFTGDSVIAGMSQKYNVPFVVVSPTYPSFVANYLVGNPKMTGSVPDLNIGFPAPMTLGQRIINILNGIISEIFLNTVHMPRQDAVMRKYFGNHLPPIVDILKNTSLLLVNYHPSMSHPSPYSPNMIDIAGMHVRPPKPLPKDLQKFMDESKNGVIFFSLGTHIKSKMMPKEKLQMFIKAFGKLPYDVLWKFEDESLPNQPKNLKVLKWIPQSDVLAHPNIKLFITHGGLFSTIETLYREVPIIGIPIMGDQHTNMKQAERIGYGLTLKLDNITEESLLGAINEVISNPKYRQIVKERSAILKDRLVPPLDTAMYHIEYVIRHNGAKHLKSLAQHQNWIEYNCLDVAVVILTTLSLVVFIFYKTTKFVICKLFFKKKAKKD